MSALLDMFLKADDDDLREGCLAYRRYRSVMVGVSEKYRLPLDRVVAAFVALSPNNDYFGNLRSLVSVLDAVANRRSYAHTTVSTYKACRDRAFSYADGSVDFWETVKGPKTRAFYRNILDPDDRGYVTIDGHMKAAYLGNERLTMREAIVKSAREYRDIASATQRLAGDVGLIPNQLQAVIWFTRKRTLHVKYDGQLGLFDDPTDKWRTIVPLSDITPYKRTDQ